MCLGLHAQRAVGGLHGGTVTDGAFSATAGAVTGVTSLLASGAITGESLASTVADGTPPLTVASTTEVANLRAATAGLADEATVLTAGTHTEITGTGALDAGSITSGFGDINTGASAITTTGIVSGGTVTDGAFSATAGMSGGPGGLAFSSCAGANLTSIVSGTNCTAPPTT
jgi:hypothetical protein